MPTLTGTLQDVTGTELQPSQIQRVFVKAPAHRPSLTSGEALIVSIPVDLDRSGTLTVELEPGPAVLVVDTYAGGQDVYELHVTADMSLLSEAVAESSPDRSWIESVMVQLRDEAVSAAGRAESAAEDAVAAAGDAADQVAGAVEQDRVRAESAASAAAGSASGAAGSASAAAGSASAAEGHASDAGGSAQSAAGSASDAGVSAGAAASSESAAGQARAGAESARDDAEAHRDQAVAEADRASGEANRAETAANGFDLTASSSTGAPGSQASVTVTGTGPAYSLDFTIPEGAKGDQGDPGEVSQAALDAAVASLVDGAPEALDTLSELAAALGHDPNFATTVSEAIGRRARIDGAPEQYDSLGKLVSALIAGDLGGSTDAGVLTGALTDQVDASAAMVTFDLMGNVETLPLRSSTQELYGMTIAVGSALESKADTVHSHTITDVSGLEDALDSKADVDHQHPVPSQAEAEAGTATTGRAFSAQRAHQAAIAASGKKDWQGTQAQYDALGTKDADRTYWIV